MWREITKGVLRIQRRSVCDTRNTSVGYNFRQSQSYETHSKPKFVLGLVWGEQYQDFK